MAPGFALDSLTELPKGSVILDPMTGSGTVMREAAEIGLRGIGYDLDPLAVLMSSVWTTPVGAIGLRLFGLAGACSNSERSGRKALAPSVRHPLLRFRLSVPALSTPWSGAPLFPIATIGWSSVIPSTCGRCWRRFPACWRLALKQPSSWETHAYRASL